MKKVTKAIIPVAGLGTRMLPATKAIPKEMLPLADKPLIQYIVNECIAAGLKDIILVTHSSKNSIENHFDTSFELESMLEKRVKRTLLSEVRSILPKDVNIMHIRQGVAKGLGHAVLSAYPLVNNEPVVVILPDVVINEFSANQTTDNLAAMLARFNSTGLSQIMVEQVAAAHVDRYGIVGCTNNQIQAGKISTIESLIEKPKLSEAPSQLAIVGRYVLSNGIWPLLRRTPVGAGDEIQLTDALRMLMELESLEAYCLVGKSHDCGNKLGYFQAFIEYAVKHQEFGQELEDWIQQQYR